MEVVQLVAAADCKSKVVEFIKDGYTCPIIHPLVDDPAKMIKQLQNEKLMIYH